MALLRGLLDESALRRALGSESDLLEALKAQGSLDAEDLRDLTNLVKAERDRHPSPSGGADPITEPFRPARGKDPWDSLPSLSDSTDGTGRQVLRVLTLPAWWHYRNLRFISEGGMGRVFKAFDPSLKRVVALKFLRREDPDLVKRFVLEAQNQAKVEHPNICKVYEVGDWQGQSYIAMQFIKGETLEAAAPGLSLIDRVKVMEAVAEAVHAAHRQGLIHRDLKPANIMVELEERGPKPTILDFGLARGVESTGLTVQGLVIGTTHYMAPEQARGDHERVGRRTDVYGLGATLHKVLTGQPPFGGTEGVDAIRCTVEEDLPSLARLDHDLPEDLDTIARKCLEKDPARRYESALAVAEDLRRWREGEPILARKPTYRYLATKWAKRHRLLVTVASVAMVALLVTGGMAVHSAATARTRARHAQHFGQEAERIEALLRYARLLPPHDVGPELAQARARMVNLEAQARRGGSLAEGPAAYALGRSHLAMGESEKAKGLLEKAWSAGLRGPEMALALGRALAASYERALDLARALPSRELREARERELVRDLRDPALARLREGAEAALESPAFHQALVAFMGGHWEEAQAKAREALTATPWLFEAKRLEGEALLERARSLQDPSAALALLSQAEEAFSAARRLGPSDPATARGELRVLAERAARELASGANADGTLLRCREALARVRTLHPEDGEARALLARSLARWAELQPAHAPATQSALQEAGALSEEALALEPENPAIAAIRIPVLLSLGTHAVRRRGLDPMPLYQEALELARRAQRRHPQEPAFASLAASACMRKMTWEINTGIPPWASFEEGLTQARALREQYPELSFAYQGLAALWVERAEFERVHGLDPRPSVAAALEAVSAAEARGLSLKNPGWTQGDAHLIRGEYLLATQGEGEDDLQQAAADYRMAVQINPNLPQAFGGVAGAMLGAARGRLERGLDPSPFLAEAEANLNRMGERSADPEQATFLLGHLALLRGRQRLAAGADPSPEWAKAEAAFQRSSTISGLARASVGRAEVRARAYLLKGRVQDRDQALAAAREALVRDPQRGEAWLWIAAVEQEAARRGEQAAAPRAREAWAKALTLDANLGRWAKMLGGP
jgi:serine/threonine-protein kinase